MKRPEKGTLRYKLAEAIHLSCKVACGCELSECFECLADADALLPVIREHAAQVARGLAHPSREEIAEALEKMS